MDELLVFSVETTATWRQTKASEYPDDAERNLAAAHLLERLASDLRALSGTTLHSRLDSVLSDEKGLDLPLSEIISQANRDVGFRSFPESGEEFLEDLIHALENEIALHVVSSKIENQLSERYSNSYTQPSHSANATAAERIMMVADYLRSLRINSLSEQISILEAVSNELTAHRITDKEPLEFLIQKALNAIGAVFDAVGSERGAQIIVSGAVAGLVGVLGWSAEASYGLTLAAWMGKDTFLTALTSLPRRRKTKKS
jgi:hypothetical protein